jgi:hypothetical protein
VVVVQPDPAAGAADTDGVGTDEAEGDPADAVVEDPVAAPAPGPQPVESLVDGPVVGVDAVVGTAVVGAVVVDPTADATGPPGGTLDTGTVVATEDEEGVVVEDAAVVEDEEGVEDGGVGPEVDGEVDEVVVDEPACPGGEQSSVNPKPRLDMASCPKRSCTMITDSIPTRVPCSTRPPFAVSSIPSISKLAAPLETMSELPGWTDD